MHAYIHAHSTHSTVRHSVSLVDPNLDRLARCWRLNDRTRMATLRRQSRAARHSALWQEIQRAVATT